ncbi:hypothetical protein B0H14DRAFT_706463 [Mycena olivaceomarginata]|nr:hypothetical protein B0H14DRAFT_706463 [Mycena olivaceomarginata]
MSTMCFPRYFSRHGKCGNGTRRCVSPGDQETSGRGARSRKVWRGQGRPHRTGATAVGSRCVRSIWGRSQRTCPEVGGHASRYTLRGGAGQRMWGQRKGGGRQVRGAAPGEQPEELITVHNCAGSGKRRRTARTCAAHGGAIQHLAALRYPGAGRGRA